MKIEANELMIGNYLKTINGIKRVSDISIDRYCWFTDNQCEPIPLTEEWLLKFGFELNEDLGDMKYYQMPNKKRCFGVCFDHEKIAFYLFNIKGVVNLIYDDSFFQYVHHLQNLYFALTNEKLTIK